MDAERSAARSDKLQNLFNFRREKVREEYSAVEGVFETRNWWQNGLRIFTVFTLLTLPYLPNFFLYEDVDEWFRVLMQNALANYLWAVLTPLVFLSNDRLIGYRSRSVRNFFLHCGLGIAFSAFHTFLSVLVWDAYRGNELFLSLFAERSVFLHLMSKALVYYAGIVAVSQAFIYFRKYRDREFRLKEAELQSLKTQLRPHFLFNTLNAISALVYSSPKDADLTITRLSELLRSTLNNGRKEEVPLKEELDFLRSYLMIHQTLMAERLEVLWRIDPETLDAAVPNMLLQPLVENSILHGLEPLERGGVIKIESSRVNGDLCLQVIDNGRGFSHQEDMENNAGIGLSNTRARLRHLYGEAHTFDLRSSEIGGLTISICIPFREQPLS